MEGHASIIARPASQPLVPAPLYIVAAAISVQAGSALAFTAFHRAGVLGIVFGRVAFGAVFVLAAVRLPRGHGRLAWRWAIAFGLALALMNSLFYEAIARLPLGPAVTIEFAGPIVVAVATSRRRLDLVWIALAAAGVALLSDGFTGTRLTGLVLILGAGAAWAVYILAGRRVAALWPGATGIGIALAIATVALAPVGLLTDGARLANGRTLLDCAVLGLLASAIPYALEQQAMRRLSASTFSVILSLHPALAAVVGAVALDQGLGVRRAGAIALVVVAAAGAMRAAAASGAPLPVTEGQ